MKNRIFQNNEGISPVLGFTLIHAIGVTILTTVQFSFVPVWNTQEELDHIKLMQDDFKVLKSNIESGIQSGTTLSSPLIMGFKYSPKMLVYNPRDEAYASLEISNNTIFIPGVKALEYGTLSGVEKRTVNIYPTSQQKNSVIGKNVWLILHIYPDYVDWWKNNLENEGAAVRKKDRTNGIVIANVSSSLVIKMREAYISTSQKTSPPHSPAARLVKVSGQRAMLPVGGTTSITVEVQDEYNNPVPNVLVNFSGNGSLTGHPSNSNANATISPTPAVSGADGRASVTLTANDAGFYYIDASLTDYKTTLVYSASSQGSVMKLDSTPSGTDYIITATLKNSLGTPVTTGTNVDFETSDGILSEYSKPTASDGTANTTLNVSDATGLKITNIQINDIARYSANITWDTINNIIVTAKSGYVFNSLDIPVMISTSCCVFYSTSPGSHSTPACSVTAFSHSVPLTGLSSNTAYYFIVNSSRPDGSIVNSTEYMFVTDATITEGAKTVNTSYWWGLNTTIESWTPTWAGTGESGYNVYVYNGTDWDPKGSLTSLAWSLANFTLSSSEIISGNVDVLYLDQMPTGDNFTLQVYNGTVWNTRETLNKSAMTVIEVPLNVDELLSDGAFTPYTVYNLNRYYVLIRYIDENASKQGKLYLDYQRVYSS